MIRPESLDPAAARFIAALDTALAEIERAPEQHHLVRGQLWRVLFREFPYGVQYKVFPMVIGVVGVVHARQHPDTWLRRAAR